MSNYYTTTLMNIWRLIPFHEPEHQLEMAEWSRRNGFIAIGWGGAGDLHKRHVGNEEEMKRLVKSTHPGFSTSSWVNGGCSLWRLYHEMKQDDLVIITAKGRRTLTMRVSGDYYYFDGDSKNPYPNRRKAEAVPIDAEHLWQFTGGMASGENIRRTLIHCGRSLSDADFKAFR